MIRIKIVLILGRGSLLLLLVLVQVVLLGELQVPQELGVTTFHAHVPPGGRLLDSTTMVLPGLKNKLLGNTMAQNYDRNNRKSQGT